MHLSPSCLGPSTVSTGRTNFGTIGHDKSSHYDYLYVRESTGR
jgi:hypothetical protein